MTDTNHIEVLRGMREHYGNNPLHFTMEKAALDAAIQSLSARASAGEGGVAAYRAHWPGGDVGAWNDGPPSADTLAMAEKYGLGIEYAYAAPQPAQAGASGGGDWTALDRVYNFLMGIADLDGVSFGEDHPKVAAGRYWWRHDLAAAYVAARKPAPASPATPASGGPRDD